LTSTTSTTSMSEISSSTSTIISAAVELGSERQAVCCCGCHSSTALQSDSAIGGGGDGGVQQDHERHAHQTIFTKIQTTPLQELDNQKSKVLFKTLYDMQSGFCKIVQDTLDTVLVHNNNSDPDTNPIAESLVKHIKKTVMDFYPENHTTHEECVNTARSCVVEAIVKPYISCRDGSYRNALQKLKTNSNIKINNQCLLEAITAEDIAHIVWSIDTVMFGGALRATLALKNHSFCVCFGFAHYAADPMDPLSKKDTCEQSLGIFYRYDGPNSVDYELFINKSLLMESNAFDSLVCTVEHELVHWLVTEFWQFQTLSHNQEFVHLLFALFRHKSIYGARSITHIHSLDTSVPEWHQQDVFWLTSRLPVRIYQSRPVSLAAGLINSTFHQQPKFGCQPQSIKTFASPYQSYVAMVNHVLNEQGFYLACMGLECSEIPSYQKLDASDVVVNCSEILISDQMGASQQPHVEKNLEIVERVFALFGAAVFVVPSLVPHSLTQGFGDDSNLPIVMALAHGQHKIVKYMLHKDKSLASRSYNINFCTRGRSHNVIPCGLTTAAYMLGGGEMLQTVFDTDVSMMRDISYGLASRKARAYDHSQSSPSAHDGTPIRSKIGCSASLCDTPIRSGIGCSTITTKLGCLLYFIIINGTKTHKQTEDAFKLLYYKYNYNFLVDNSWHGCEQTRNINIMEALSSNNRLDALYCVYRWYPQSCLELFTIPKKKTSTDPIKLACANEFASMLVELLEIAEFWNSCDIELLKIAIDSQSRNVIDVLLYICPEWFEYFLQYPCFCGLLIQGKSWRFAGDKNDRIPQQQNLSWWKSQIVSWQKQKSFRTQILTSAAQNPCEMQTIDTWATRVTSEMLDSWTKAPAPPAFLDWECMSSNTRTDTLFAMSPLVWTHVCKRALLVLDHQISDPMSDTEDHERSYALAKREAVQKKEDLSLL